MHTKDYNLRRICNFLSSKHSQSHRQELVHSLENLGQNYVTEGAEENLK